MTTETLGWGENQHAPQSTLNYLGEAMYPDDSDPDGDQVDASGTFKG